MKIDNFSGRIAVVTGAASGIGKGIAEQLLRAGATVVVADVDDQGARAAAEELGVGAHAHHVDVTDPGSVQALADGVIAEHGRVDIVVNNAGVGPLAPFSDLTVEDFRWVMDINFWGVVHGLKSFLPLLRQNPHGGYVVNTASVAALIPAPGTTAYAASKAGVVAVTEALAAELSEDDTIGVALLLPAVVRTNINTNATKRPGHHSGAAPAEDFLPPLPLLDPSEVGAMVVAGLRNGERYIVTHPETRGGVEARHQALTASYDRLGR